MLKLVRRLVPLDGPAGTAIGGLIGFLGGCIANLLTGSDDYEDQLIPMIEYSPATIFSGQIPIFNINYIETPNYEENSTTTEMESKITQKANEILNNKNSSAEEKDWAQSINTTFAASPIGFATAGMGILGYRMAEQLGIFLGDMLAPDDVYKDGTAVILRSVISKWYMNLRSFIKRLVYRDVLSISYSFYYGFYLIWFSNDN